MKYSQELPHRLVAAILDADKALQPAPIGVATESVRPQPQPAHQA